MGSYFDWYRYFLDILLASLRGQIDKEDLIAASSGTRVTVFVPLHGIVCTLLLTHMTFFLSLHETEESADASC